MPGKSFDDIKRSRWKSSLGIFAFIVPVYFVATTIGFGIFLVVVYAKLSGNTSARGHRYSYSRGYENRSRPWVPASYPGGWPGFFGTSLVVSIGMAWLQYDDAKRHGARRILKLLNAYKPDPLDTYHKRFSNLAEEMAVANGLPGMNAYVTPSQAVNCMALIEADGTPAVLATEGMLGECTRDELQAAVAHELAHILSGDAFFVTLVCSMASLFEKGGDAASTEGDSGTVREHATDLRDGIAAGAGAAGMGKVMRLMSCMVGREREYLADARAADMTRNPMALATVLYKAHLNYSQMGSFHMSYSPLFLVAPQSEGLSNEEGWWAKMWSTHPPIRKRLQAVAAMALVDEQAVFRAAWEQRKMMEAKRSPVFGTFEQEEESGSDGPAEKPEEKTLEILDPDGGQWKGPFSPAEIMALPFFAPAVALRDAASGFEAPAHQFRAIQGQLASGKKGSFQCPAGHGRLGEVRYEGVAIHECSRCKGRCLRSRDDAAKIIARKGVSFSQALHWKAKGYRDNLMVSPYQKVEPGQGADGSAGIACPSCGSPMTMRPYNYLQCVPIDECGVCGALWFDPDELEILQILCETDAASGNAGATT